MSRARFNTQSLIGPSPSTFLSKSVQFILPDTMSRRRLGLTAAEVANEVIDDYAVPFGSSSACSGSSSSNESNFPGEPSFASNNHGTTFFTPVHGNSASQPGRNSRVPFDNRELRYSTPASTRQPLHDLGRRSNAPTAAFGQPMDLPSLECQQMLENFNALEEICKKTASQQDDFKKTVIEKFDELSQKLTESLAHQPHPEKRKKMETPCELSKRLKNLSNTDESLAFRAMNGWNVNHNKQVREKLAEQLKMKFGDKYTEEEFEFAIRRKYENERIKARETRNSDLRRNWFLH